MTGRMSRLTRHGLIELNIVLLLILPLLTLWCIILLQVLLVVHIMLFIEWRQSFSWRMVKHVPARDCLWNLIRPIQKRLLFHLHYDLAIGFEASATRTQILVQK